MGGGENEGHQGVHAQFESIVPGYVRRMCLPHTAWGTCDLAIRVSGLDYKALCAYLCDGITWSRLRQIAITGPALGGLKMMKESTPACKRLVWQEPHLLAVCPGLTQTSVS